MRSKTALFTSVAATALALSLAGCGGQATPSASATAPTSAATGGTADPTPTATPTPTPTAHPAVAASNTIDGITVTDVVPTPTPAATTPGATPTPPAAATPVPQIAFKAPFAIDQTRSKVLKAGTGAVVQKTSVVSVNYVGVNGYDGKTFDSSFTRGQPAQFSLEQVVPGFATGLTGHKVGDRVLIAMPGKDAYDSQGGNPQAGILVGDTLIFVVDLVDIDYQTPSGTPVTPAAGLPAVSADAKGLPVVTINTASPAPTSTVIQPLIKGASTTTIKASDAIMVHYRSWSWKTGQQLEDHYDSPDTGTLADLLPCWKEGLVNQTLGSRIMLICPPSSGYPNGNTASPSVAAGDTVVYIVDPIMSGAAQ